MESYKIIIAGGRDFDNLEIMSQECDRIINPLLMQKDITIVSGHARGTDRLGEQYARQRDFKTEIFPAEWEKYGKAAGYVRNKEMANVADALIAFWDGQSRGTANMINLAKSKGLKVAIVRYTSFCETVHP